MDRDAEKQIAIDLIIRMAKDPMGVMIELSEEINDLLATIKDYRATLEEIGRDPTTRAGRLASEVVRKHPPPHPPGATDERTE